MFESRVFEQSFLNSLLLYQFCTKEVGTMTDFFTILFLRFMLSFSFD